MFENHNDSFNRPKSLIKSCASELVALECISISQRNPVIKCKSKLHTSMYRVVDGDFHQMECLVV